MRGPPISRRFPRRARLSARCSHVTATCPCRTAPLTRLKGTVRTARRHPDSRPDCATRCLSRAVVSPHLARACPDRAIVRVQGRSSLSERATVAVRMPPPPRAAQAEAGPASCGSRALRTRAKPALWAWATRDCATGPSAVLTQWQSN
jgi:hypothetical protein